MVRNYTRKIRVYLERELSNSRTKYNRVVVLKFKPLGDRAIDTPIYTILVILEAKNKQIKIDIHQEALVDDFKKVMATVLKELYFKIKYKEPQANLDNKDIGGEMNNGNERRNEEGNRETL